MQRESNEVAARVALKRARLEDHGWTFRTLAAVELAYAIGGAMIGASFAIGETLPGAAGAASLLLWTGLVWLVGGKG